MDERGTPPPPADPADPPEGGDAQDLPEQLRVRRAKRERMIAAGTDPYPVVVARTTSLAAVRAAHADLAAGVETDEVVSVTGRVVFARGTGKLAFATLQEGDGTRLQAMLSLREVGADALAAWGSDVDLGDVVSVTGRVIASRRGELSVLASSWAMATKALRPLPVLHEGATTAEETRVRARHADLIVRPAARAMVRTRAAVVRSIREALHADAFVELETPMLQTLHGGAAARPFVTRSNALDLDLYLRIAPELFLKRALVGGVERCFEMNRVFRNEGADSTHSPEFTMLEYYEAWSDYDGVATRSRELIQGAARAAFGTEVVTLADGSEYDLSGEWEQLSMYPSLSSALGEEVTPATALAPLAARCERLGLSLPPGAGPGRCVEGLWEHLVGRSLHAPTFVRDFPEETSPLTKSHRSVAGVVEKWDLYVRGVEVGTGYSELNDPVVQRRRLVEQAALAERGDDEAMVIDEDFLAALETGMPPAGGVGLGIDRVLTAMTGLGIRETILFPLVRPR